MSIRNFKLFDQLNTPAEEAYRVLRTNLQFCALDKDLKTIAVTSTFAGEGKTTTAVNLAISMAKVGKKVLYVDGDMRKAISAKDVFEKVAAGLSNYLSRMDDFESVVNETNIPNLYIVPCGIRPPNPAELLNTQRLKEFLQEASELFDVVILDTPPLGSVIDCAIIANHTDGVILVIKRKTADYNKILRVKQQLEKANARILGVVLNKIGKSDYKSYYKYYDYHNKKSKRLGIRLGKFGK
jgi:protein-tyrosine kinase